VSSVHAGTSGGRHVLEVHGPFMPLSLTRRFYPLCHALWLVR
jgi:hypothetical protein